MVREPMALTVAGEEPDRAAKNMEATTETIPSEPLMWPTSASANSRILFDRPPNFIRLPARMKNGTASSGNESRPLKHAVAMVVIPRLVVVTSVMTVEAPSAMAIGAPIIMKRKRSAKINTAFKIIFRYSPFFLLSLMLRTLFWMKRKVIRAMLSGRENHAIHIGMWLPVAMDLLA